MALPVQVRILRIFRVLRPFRAVRISGLYVSVLLPHLTSGSIRLSNLIIYTANHAAGCDWSDFIVQVDGQHCPSDASGSWDILSDRSRHISSMYACMHACMHHRRRLCHAVFGIIIIIIIGTILLLHGSCSDDGRKMSVRCCVLSLLVTDSTPFYSGHFFSYEYFDRSHAIPDLSCPEVSDYNLLWTDSFHYNRYFSKDSGTCVEAA